MKKKLLIIISIVIMCAFFTACASSEVREEESSSSTEITTTEISETQQATEKVNNTAKEEKTTASKPKETQKQTEKQTKPQATAKQTTEKPATEKQTEKTTEETKKSVTVTLSISCKNAMKYDESLPQYFAENESYTAKDGDTVYTALSAICEKNNLSLEANGNYIVAIGGLREKQFNSACGWVYTVNGKLPPKPMKKCILQNGDKIEIYYVTSGTDKA